MVVANSACMLLLVLHHQRSWESRIRLNGPVVEYSWNQSIHRLTISMSCVALREVYLSRIPWAGKLRILPSGARRHENRYKWQRVDGPSVVSMHKRENETFRTIVSTSVLTIPNASLSGARTRLRQATSPTLPSASFIFSFSRTTYTCANPPCIRFYNWSTRYLQTAIVL